MSRSFVRSVLVHEEFLPLTACLCLYRVVIISSKGERETNEWTWGADVTPRSSLDDESTTIEWKIKEKGRDNWWEKIVAAFLLFDDEFSPLELFIDDDDDHDGILTGVMSTWVNYVEDNSFVFLFCKRWIFEISPLSLLLPHVHSIVLMPSDHWRQPKRLREIDGLIFRSFISVTLTLMLMLVGGTDANS